MRLGTRISVTTTVLVALTLGIYGLVTTRRARWDIETEIERRTNEMGDFVAAEASYLEALRYEPENRFALRELEAVRREMA